MRQLTAAGVRQTKSGRWEATISHRLLPTRRVFRVFATEQEARAYKLLMLAQLQRGCLPPELTRAGQRCFVQEPVVAQRRPQTLAPPAALRGPAGSPALAHVVHAYLRADNARIALSDRSMLEFLAKTLSGSVTGVTARWADAWIRAMKRQEGIAPGTIRKRVESLARCIDWWWRDQGGPGEGFNPLRVLPRGYSVYGPQDLPAVPAAQLPRDCSRNRRLLPDEYETIVATLQGAKGEGRQRAFTRGGDPELLLLFRLLVATALRLREAYMLRVCDIRFELRTIHIRASKTGTTRDVPMTREVEGWLRAHIGERPATAPVFSYWSGSTEPAALELVTGRLSARFAALFRHAGLEDIVCHDLRHEATCRWMEIRDPKGGWLFRPEEVRKITGHKTDAMFMRYLSLRGSDLAQRLE